MGLTSKNPNVCFVCLLCLFCLFALFVLFVLLVCLFVWLGGCFVLVGWLVAWLVGLLGGWLFCFILFCFFVKIHVLT